MASKKYNIKELQEIRKTWKDITADVVPEEKRAVFLQRKKAIDMYIDGRSVKEIYDKTGLRHNNISKFIDRCLQTDEKGGYKGYSSLLLYKRIDSKSKNVAGRFMKMLEEHPELKAYIEGCWYGDKKYTLERNMSYNSLHKKFLKKCLELGISEFEYPFNTSNRGYVSLCKYVKELDKEKISKAATRENKDNMQKLMSTGYGERYTKNAIFPFSVVQIDGHIIDLMYNVEILNEDGTIDRKPATRAWLIAVIDVATRCVLGYSVSQEFNYNQYDVIEAFQNAIMPHKNPTITINGLRYPENGGYYQTAYPELSYALFDTVMLDNAKSHLAHNTVEKVVDQLKCSMNFGSVATPETRGIVERFFGTLETRGFHRLPATTGSNTTDLKRREPEKTAVKYDITYDQIIQLLDVLIAEYNNTPHGGLDNRTPLEVMKNRTFDSIMRPTIADDDMKKIVEKLNYITVTRVVRGGKNGKRAYINYEGAEYRGNELSATGIYLGKGITILVDPRDVSEVEAYSEDGTYIGILRARGEFGTKSHSLKTRKNARKLSIERGRNNLDFDPAITAYEQELNERGKTSRRDATKADIVRRERSAKKYSEAMNEKELDPTPVIPIKESEHNPLFDQKFSDTEEYYRAVWGR